MPTKFLRKYKSMEEKNPPKKQSKKTLTVRIMRHK